MILLNNLSHPLTEAQRAQIEQLTDQPISRRIEQMARFDPAQGFAEQAASLVDSLGLSSAEWQQKPILLILPSLNFGAAVVLTELHGRCGYFPPIVRTRPVPNSLPPRYEIAEIINLQSLRDSARDRR